MTVSLEHRYADVNGVRLHYVTAGTEGTLVMFLHGFPEFWYEWKRALEEFGRDHQAVAPDMRGYNLSGKPAGVEPYGIEHLVEDVRALAEHLGHRRFVLVGHDWGGVVAWVFAMRHPEWLEKLVIVNAPHPAIFDRELKGNPAQQQASQYMLFFRSPEAEATLSANGFGDLWERLFASLVAAGRFTGEDRQAYLAAWAQPGALTGGLNYYRAARVGPPIPGTTAASGTVGLEAGQTTIDVPTLVIWGEKDEALLPGNLDGLEHFVTTLTVHRVPDATHWVVHEEPALVNRLIRDFIGGRSPRAARRP